MPPQPLSNVKSSAAVKWDSEDALLKRPELAALVARAIASWAYAESGMGDILIQMLGARAEPAAKMYAALNSNQAQFDALNAAARCCLQPDELETFQAVVWVVRKAARMRHRLAHNLWCYSDDLSDALLLLDADAWLQFSIEQNIFRFHQTALVAALEERPLPNFPKDRVFVYREHELLEIIKQILTARNVIGMFSGALALEPPGRGANYYELLLEPQIQEALSRLQKQQKNGP